MAPSNARTPLAISADTEHSYGTTSSDDVAVAGESSSLIPGDGGSNLNLQQAPPPSPRGTRTIGMLGGVAIAVNSLTGPAMLDLPATFQRSGVVPTCSVLIFVCVLSALCSLHMANVISKVPGNADFSRTVEYSDAFRIFWGQKAYILTHVAFFVCITCLNISSVVDTAQIIDQIIAHVFGYTSAFRLSLSGTNKVKYWSQADCGHHRIAAGECIPFHHQKDDQLLITLGYVTTVGLFLPLAMMDLKENIFMQIVGFVVLLAISLQFIVSFCLQGLSFDNISIWGDDWTDLFGVVLFNFAVLLAVPAWLAEKDPRVDVTTVINGSSVLSVILYVVIGILGALAIPQVAENMLSSMVGGIFGTTTQIGAEIFALFIIGLGIPLFSVLARLNLTGSGLCSTQTGNLLAVGLPFGVSFIFYKGTFDTILLSWGGTLFTSLIVFIYPLFLAYHTLDQTGSEGSIRIYGNYFQSKSSQHKALIVLIVLSLVSVLLAFAGEIIELITAAIEQDDDDDDDLVHIGIPGN